MYLVEFVAVAVAVDVVVDEVGVGEGVAPSSPATLAASLEEVVGTSCEDGEEGHGVELVEDSLAPPHQASEEEEGEIPHHYSVASSYEGVLASYERAWHG